MADAQGSERPRKRYLLLVLLLAAAVVAGVTLVARMRLGPGPANAIAHFTALEGTVQVRSVRTLHWVDADEQTALKRGDLVRTGPGATAVIRYHDGTDFRLRPQSLIAIDPTWTDGNEDDPSRRSEPIRDWEPACGRIEPKANEGASTGAAGGEGKVVLPGVPKLLAPPHASEIAHPDPERATTVLAWEAVTGAACYHVMVDYGPSFARPPIDRKDWKVPSMELKGLEPGTYYWRVSAVDSDGAEGSFSEPSRFTIVKSP